MPNILRQKSHVKRMTLNREYKYAGHSSEIGEVVFTKNMNMCYYNDFTFKKIKRGGDHGGNYICVEQNDEYRISKY